MPTQSILLRGTSISKESTAYHEASHSVVAWHYEIPITTITIVRKGETLGCVHLTDPLQGFRTDLDYFPHEQRKMERLADHWAAAQLAGPVGAWIYDRQAYTDYKDHENAVVYRLANLCGSADEVAEWLGDLVGRTERLLRRRWGRVGRVAKALLERSEITSEELKFLLENARRGV